MGVTVANVPGLFSGIYGSDFWFLIQIFGSNLILTADCWEIWTERATALPLPNSVTR